jgi:hypothetical protein
MHPVPLTPHLPARFNRPRHSKMVGLSCLFSQHAVASASVAFLHYRLVLFWAVQVVRDVKVDQGWVPVPLFFHIFQDPLPDCFLEANGC